MNHKRKNNSSVPQLNLAGIDFKEIKPDLFDTIADQTAVTLSKSGKECNKPTQLRRFFDDVVMWEEKIRQNPERFNEYLPFIRMINAKAAYSQGRNNVDTNFQKLMAHCLGMVDSEKEMKIFKLFFEAVMGFYKQYK